MARKSSLWGFELRGLPVGLVAQVDARRIVGAKESLSELVAAGEFPLVLVPRIRPDSLRVRTADLDRYLRRRSDASWTPLPRWGRRAVIGSEEAAAYLGLSLSQLHGLRKAGYLPHLAEPYSSTTTAFRYRVADLDAMMDEWVEAWKDLH